MSNNKTKIYFCVVTLLAFLIPQICFAAPNLFFSRPHSVEPTIDCLKVKQFGLPGDMGFVNECEELIYINEDSDILSVPHYIIFGNENTTQEEIAEARKNFYKSKFKSRIYSTDLLISEGNFKSSLLSKCGGGNEHITPDGVNWCDKDAVSEYFSRTGNVFLVLGYYQVKAQMGESEINLVFESLYQAPPKMTNGQFILLLGSITALLILSLIVGIVYLIMEHRNKNN